MKRLRCFPAWPTSFVLGFLALSIAARGEIATEDHLTIVALGDSITKGVRPGVRPEQTFSAVFEAKLRQQGLPVEVHNVGIGGERTDQALRRLDQDVIPLRPDLVIVMYGTNDSWVDKGKAKSRLSAETYEANLRELIQRLRAAHIQPILMTEPMYGDGFMPNGAGEEANVRITGYMDVCRKVAADLQVPLVDNFSAWGAARKGGHPLQDWTTDGCHPNPAGHAVIAEAMVRALLPLVQVSLRADAASGVGLKVGRTVEITQSHGHCWYPTIHRFRSGEIMVGMNLSPDEINAESSFSAFSVSRDGGLTWSPRFSMGAGAAQDGAWSEAPDEDDAIWQWGDYPTQLREGDTSNFSAALTKYSHGGRRISIDRDVEMKVNRPAYLNPTWMYSYRFDGKVPVPDTRVMSQFSGRPWGGIIPAANGDLLCCCYYTSTAEAVRVLDDAKHRPKGRRFMHAILLRSSDRGHTWVEYSTIAEIAPGERPAWMGSEGPCEVSLCRLADGRLYSVYRTGGNDGMIGHGWSADDGKTWTAPAPIGFYGVAPRVHCLHSGMLVMVTGRPGPVALRINPDGRGEKWSAPLLLYEGTSTHYTDVAEITPGHLLAVYDALPYGWHEIPAADRDARNKIYGTFVDLAAP